MEWMLPFFVILQRSESLYNKTLKERKWKERVPEERPVQGGDQDGSDKQFGNPMQQPRASCVS